MRSSSSALANDAERRTECWISTHYDPLLLSRAIATDHSMARNNQFLFAERR